MVLMRLVVDVGSRRGRGVTVTQDEEKKDEREMEEDCSRHLSAPI